MHPVPPGFHKAPFEPSADPSLIFHHASLEKTRAEFMLSQISDRRGLFLVVGEPGTGKTTLLLSLRLQSGTEKPYAYLVCSEEESYAALVESCCKALGIAAEDNDAESLKQALVAHLTSRSEAGVATTLLIDSAENLTDDALKGLAEIAEADVAKRRLLHIVVVARPEIESALERIGLDQSDEAIAFQCRLDALSQEEIEAYIDHRLKAAGYEGPALFSDEALQRIGAASKGLPGQVSQLCRAALQAIQEDGRETVEDDVAAYAIERCGLTDEYQPAPQSAVMLSEAAIREIWESAEGGAEDGSRDRPLVLAHYLKDRPESDAGTGPGDAEPAGRRPWRVPFDWHPEKGSPESEMTEVLAAWKDAEPENAMTWRRLSADYWPAAAVVAAGVLIGTAFAAYQAPGELWARLGIGSPDEVEIKEIETAEIQAAAPTPAEQIPAATDEDTAPPQPEISPDSEPAEIQAAAPSVDPPPAPATELAALPVEAPRLTVSAANGDEDQGIPIDLQVRAAGGNPDVELTLELAELPEGTVLSAGTNLRDGRWALKSDQLSGLKLLPPEHYSGSFLIEVVAVAKGTDGDSASTIEVLPVTVTGVADPPMLKVADASGREDEAVPLEIQAARTDRDGSEQLILFLADLPEGATLSAGVHEGDGNWSLTAEQLSGLELRPPENFSGSFEISAGAVAQETDSEDRKIATGILTVTLAGVADEPQLKVSDASGPEDQAIPLNIEAGPTDTDGSELLEVVVSGLPEAARLTVGESHGDGTWKLSQQQLTEVSLLPPDDFNGTMTLTVGATSREADSDDQALVSSSVTVNVTAVTDAPRLAVTDSSGSEDSPIPLDIQASLKEGISAGTLSILLSNLPEGARLSAGSDDGDGRWILEPEQLADLQLNPPPSFSGAFEITAEAIATEDGNKETATAKEALKVTVAGVADKPHLAVRHASGWEDKPITLEITASLGDADGSEKLSIFLTGLPEGAQLSAGEVDANGVWRLTERQLLDLKLVPPPHFNGEFEITAGAVSLEDGGNTAKITRPLKVVVEATQPAAEAQADNRPAEPQPEPTQQAARTPIDSKAQQYMGRGNDLLALGDVAAARLFYELALDHGHPAAATAIGTTYDPLALRQLGVHGAANKDKAIEWYKQAVRAGDKSATIRLKALSQNQN